MFSFFPENVNVPMNEQKEFMPLLKFRQLLFMLLLACVVGILAGLGTLLFKELVGFFHNLFFLGQMRFGYKEIVHTLPSPWGLGVILVPVLGGLIVIGLIENFAHAERGLSIPYIMYSLRHGNGKIQPSTAFAKTIAALISISSGASIGREGPVVQISAALSSLLSDVGKLSIEQRKLLIAAGVAAGTAAIFNAPLAGVVFAIELFLISYNTFSILFIIVSAITATFIEHLFKESTPIFNVAVNFPEISISLVLVYLALSVLLGIVIGFLSIVFIRGIYWMEDFFNALKNPYLRHVIGMLLIGIMIYFLMKLSGHYYIEGVGFSTIQDCLSLVLTSTWFLLLLFVLKLIATCLSLGTGASGGVFSPALYLGAILGTMYGFIFHYLLPSIDINPVIFTLVGMASVVAGTTGAVVTAIILVFEMTRDVYSLLPMIITCFITYFVRRHFCPESVYTLKLVRYRMDVK